MQCREWNIQNLFESQLSHVEVGRSLPLPHTPFLFETTGSDEMSEFGEMEEIGQGIEF